MSRSRGFDAFRKGTLWLLPLVALFTLTAGAIDAYLVSGNNAVIAYYQWRVRLCSQLSVCRGEVQLASAYAELEKGYFSQFLPIVIGYGFAFAWSIILFLFAISPQGQWIAPITSGLAKPKIAKALLSPLSMLAQSTVFFVYTLGTQSAVTRPTPAPDSSADVKKVIEPCTYDVGSFNCQINNAGFSMGWISIATLLALVVLSIIGLVATPRSLGGIRRDEPGIKDHDDANAYQQQHSYAPAPLYPSGAPAPVQNI